MKKKHGHGGRSLAERLNEGLDIPADVLPSATLVTIRAESSVSVTGARKILLYSPTRIRLATKKGAILIVGERLVCTSYHPEGVRIDGRIFSVSFGEVCDEAL